MKQFPVGFWNYVPIDQVDVSCVQDWADAGMTLTMGPDFGPEERHVTKMREILDAAQRLGIRVILCDRRLSWRVLSAQGEEKYRSEFQNAVKELGSHPSVFGFHVGDEPGREDFSDACKAIRIQKTLAPHLHPFCNLLPWHDGVEQRVGFEIWSEYLDEYVKKAEPDFLCYDCYSQMNPDTQGWDMYFRNLREYGESARKHNIPFWTTLLSVGHFRYRCPKEDDFRWQLNTALAHGASGILYFFFYMQLLDNYRVSPIDEHGERTETFAWLSRVNRTFLKGPAAIIRELTLQKVNHVGKAWGDCPLFDGSGRVSRIRSLQDTSLILSEFKHTNGSEYLMVVNNSPTESTQVEMAIHGRQLSLYRVGWHAEETLVVAGDGWNAQKGEDYLLIRPWLAPGQMELYRLECK